MKLDDGPKEEARQVVFKDTKKRFDNKAYIVCPGEIQCSISDKDCDPALLQATVKPYNFSDLTEDKWFSDLPKMFTIDPAVCVIPDDCIDTTFALDMLFSQEKIAMLNMANSTRPGGFYLEGHLAQEESIFIRSNIYKYLDPECTSDQKDREHRHYPLPEVGGLYVPNVLAIRNHEKYCYSLCVPRHINVICVAGLNMTQSGVYFAEKHGAIIKNKIRTIFRIAAENGHTVLVLGALGCGQFKNPVDEVVRIFGEVIEESKGLFEAIVFSILPDRSKNITN